LLHKNHKTRIACDKREFNVILLSNMHYCTQSSRS